LEARFYGRYEHSLDGKGRLILPAKFRGPFDHGGFLTAQDGCLALWTPAQFDVQSEAWLNRSSLTKDDRNLMRLWSSTSHELEVDRQGRMPIPQQLREWAALEGEVLVLGAINRVELWNPTAWEEKVAPQADRLTEGDDG
jgi:MraZ protein